MWRSDSCWLACFHLDQDTYRVTAFVGGLEDLDGQRLNLDDIGYPNHRPLDVLLEDHFLNGILKDVRGFGEVEELSDEEDFYDDLREGYVNLADKRRWGGEKGKELFELVLKDRLFDTRVEQES